MSVAKKGGDLCSSTTSRINHIYAGFQSLPLNGQSKTYHAIKFAGLCGIFVSSMLSLNIEGAIASGIGLGDEVTFLEKLPTDSPKPPGRDIS